MSASPEGVNELLLLGLLGHRRMHGYELHDLLERQLGFLTELKKPTAYRLLEGLHQRGLVDRDVERQGRRPERRVYRLTERGRERFLTLLREELERPGPLAGSGSVPLLFADHLPPAERIELLARRRSALAGRRSQLADLAARHSSGTTARLVLEHHVAILDAELAWLAGAADRFHDTEVPTEPPGPS